MKPWTLSFESEQKRWIQQTAKALKTRNYMLMKQIINNAMSQGIEPLRKNLSQVSIATELSKINNEKMRLEKRAAELKQQLTGDYAETPVRN